MRKELAVIIRRIIGTFLILLGIPGIPFPVVSGVLLMVIGLYVLSLDSKWFRRKLNDWIAHDVRIAETFQKIDKRVRTFFNMKDL